MENKKIVGFYDYTVILTYLGMVFAFAGILSAINRSFTACIFCLICAGICDMFDGTVASTKQRDRYEKHFGIQIDSLCDLVSFGVLPAIFLYMFSDQKLIAGMVACIYLLFALIRLAYYNVQEYERQQKTDEAREFYLGVPVTTVAIVLPLTYALYTRYHPNNSSCFILLLFSLSIGFISGIEIRKPKLIKKRSMEIL